MLSQSLTSAKLRTEDKENNLYFGLKTLTDYSCPENTLHKMY